MGASTKRQKGQSKRQSRRGYWKKGIVTGRRKRFAHDFDYEMEFAHTFKAKSPSSTLTRDAKEIAIQAVKDRCAIKYSKKIISRMLKKRLKIKALPQFDPQTVGGDKKIPLEFLEENLIYFSGRDDTKISGIPSAKYLVKSAPKDLVVLDRKEGLHVPGVCTLVPRLQAARAYQKGFVSRVYDALSFGESLKPRPTKRASNKRVVCQESKGDGSRYVCYGTHLKLASQGLGQSMKGLETDQEHHRSIGKLVKTVEKLGTAYMDTESLLAIQAVRKHCKHYSGLDLGDGEKSKIWPSVSAGRNVFLSAHKDIDFSLSVTTPIVKDEEMDENGKLKWDSPIINYFCFPEHGFCVALRSGDILLFNALVYHCVSSRCDVEKDVYCLSMYLKTGVVGGNNNGEESRSKKKKRKEKAKRRHSL